MQKRLERILKQRKNGNRYDSPSYFLDFINFLNFRSRLAVVVSPSVKDHLMCFDVIRTNEGECNNKTNCSADTSKVNFK